VRVVGTIAPLIELGLGMNPELTGRENIFINGAMLGYSTKEISRKYDRIVEFSELGDFIDSPLRTYSSGMMARLAFSVAVDVEPDILVVDEALAVGDEAFQRKCSDRLKEFRKQGVTTIYVTHGVATLGQFCDSAVVIEAGQIVFQGEIDQAVYTYRKPIGTEQAESSSDEMVGALSTPEPL
jgi:ABC-type polysaccharide/polyol phosphate transport system ATPase subunit